MEWDFSNIIEHLNKPCRYDGCDCKKINRIRLPKGDHYAKEVCSKCGRWQKWTPFPVHEIYRKGLDIT